MIKVRDDVVFQDPQTRIREYCRIEIYQGYDDKHAINNILSKEDIEAANNLYAMIDRYDNTESKRLLNHSDAIAHFLLSIPNREIYIISNEEWSTIRKNISRLLAEFLSLRGFGLAKATKILHLKRPSLFPVLDSFVVKFLLGVDISVTGKNRQVNIGLQAIEEARKIVTDQKKEFQELAKDLSDLPIPLTLIRMFDILCWTTEKWDIRGIHKAPYGTPYESLLKPFKGEEPKSRITPKEMMVSEYVVFEDLARATGPKVHHVNCFDYKRWLSNPTSTTMWHGPYKSEEKAWEICKRLPSKGGFEPSKHSCVVRLR